MQSSKAGFIYNVVNWRETLEMRTCAREYIVYPDIKKTRWLFRHVARYAHICVSLVNTWCSFLNEDILAKLCFVTEGARRRVWFKHEGSSRTQWNGICLFHEARWSRYTSLRITARYRYGVPARCESLLTLAVMDGKPFSPREPVYCRHVYNLRAT